jgi:threonine synthase
MTMPTQAAGQGVVARYRDWMPLEAGDPVISLGEGNTPLLSVPTVANRLNCDVRVKVEGANPTGSFKDRGMAVAVSRAAAENATAVICASTGNTAASAAAYAGRAGLRPLVLLPAGRIAAAKLAQAAIHGAHVVQVDGNFDDCLVLARQLADNYPVALVNSVNPARLDGQQTAAFEIVDELGDAPDICALPVGNGGNISAYWRGFTRYAAHGHASRCPAIWGFQAAGAAPLVSGEPVDDPDTVASAIRIGHPASTRLAVAARDESGGRFDSVTDEEILAAQSLLAKQEGIFAEPASAAGIAGLLKLADQDEVAPGQLIAVVVTGHGLKDVDTALTTLPPITDTDVIEPDVTAVAAACGF